MFINAYRYTCMYAYNVYIYRKFFQEPKGSSSQLTAVALNDHQRMMMNSSSITSLLSGASSFETASQLSPFRRGMYIKYIYIFIFSLIVVYSFICIYSSMCTYIHMYICMYRFIYTYINRCM